MSLLRIYIIVRGELTISAGKLAGQAGHAVLGAYLDAVKRTPEVAAAYEADELHAKIVLQGGPERELVDLVMACGGQNIPHHLVTDAGLTEFSGPTVTCLGIGPISKEDAEAKLNMRAFPLYRK